MTKKEAAANDDQTHGLSHGWTESQLALLRELQRPIDPPTADQLARYAARKKELAAIDAEWVQDGLREGLTPSELTKVIARHRERVGETEPPFIHDGKNVFVSAKDETFPELDHLKDGS